ncbi:MAG TPA: endopeptidase La, partial [Desulfuromonadales bacterium]|nr:endopeptidase La [Desulfuromonadales bacterium]
LVSEALVQSINTLIKIAMANGRPLPTDVMKMIDRIEDPGRLADLVAVYLALPAPEQQRMLENLDPIERLKDVYILLGEEVQKLQVRGDVQNEVTRRIGESQKEAILREQLKEIQEELGDGDPRQEDINEFRQAISENKMPESVRRTAERELARLQRTSSSSPEYTVSRNYLEYLCNMPWFRATKERLDLREAQKFLDEDHHDLEDVKERILEYLAVRSLKAETKGPILCFVGPPGVGKTSLGRSIARAMGREFIRLSLGGMKDEAEIRGHRRTYIGALPGRIIHEIFRCEANNPVFMLDEVDKIGQDFRGDPSSALLEVLDPEQNDSFTDHYLDVPFDLSKVMFICTANVIDPVPFTLRDRMEVVNLSGYSDEDKERIAFKYLIPKQCRENGLDVDRLCFEEKALRRIIRLYTREAGVRDLERQIASVCRKVAKEIALGSQSRERIAPEDVEKLLGPRKFFSEVTAEEDRIGVATGLAWTESGGDIIFVEASAMPGRKDLVLTGSLGTVMQESARTALSYVRSRCVELGITEDFFEAVDIHIHVPSGAIPKDGPSAGLTIATALISLLTGRPARRDVAMTGEMTLSGRILPIGGIKEKVLAARRAGVTTVLLPSRNRENLEQLDKTIRSEMSLVLVETLTDVLEYALDTSRRPVESPAGIYRSSRPNDDRQPGRGASIPRG